MSNSVRQSDAEQEPRSPVPHERLRGQAHELTRRWNVVHRPDTESSFKLRMEDARERLDALYSALNNRPVSKDPVHLQADPLLQLRENPRLLRAVMAEMHSLLRQLSRLPRVLLANGTDEPRVAAVAAAFLRASENLWFAGDFHIFVTELQQDDPLQLEELWSVAALLKFCLLEQILLLAGAMLHDPSTNSAPLSTQMKSLREVGHADWVPIVEPLIAFDALLRQDPAQAYHRMDFESREDYRKRIAKISRFSEANEMQVTAAALQLAREAQDTAVSDPRLYLRHTHVGYYLHDKGFRLLAPRIGYRPRIINRLRIAIRNHADDFYIIGIELTTLIIMAAIVAPLIPYFPPFGIMVIAIILLLLPATQGAVDLLNNTVTALFPARSLPRLDFSEGIPADCTTLVAVPTLLTSAEQTRTLVEELEIRFLSNQDRHLHFALLTDLPDSVARPRENDGDPLVDLAAKLIRELNDRYAGGARGRFLLLHRHRMFNARQGVWMGWERKRGKLLDLNKYLKGEFDAFPVKAGDLDALRNIRYIITLDSDTQLPRGSARKMIGAIAHPLNRAIIDPRLRIVTEGYGLLQPRVGISVSSAVRSRLAAIYSGHTGFDIYARAISDAYQDLYGEGIFTGKGIYEVDTFHQVLDRRFPRNSLLSHDLIEGAYLRVGLATDIEVVDDYPSHYSAYARRQHRWVRGDWQIAQWVFSRVPDEAGNWVRNPISTISRWKILDNLRRSLVGPFTFLLLLAGWMHLPGGPRYWTLATLLILFAPGLVQFCFTYGHAMTEDAPGAKREALASLWQTLGIVLLNLAFLPHQALLSLDAIVRSLVRRFVTGVRMLEWETAAEAEVRSSQRTPVDRYLTAMPLVALMLGLLVAVVNHYSLPFAIPILLLWGFSTAIALWLDRPPSDPQMRLSKGDDVFLREMALRIWRFYAEFGNADHHYLIPDNVEEDGLFEAARVSPTNVGMLLNARQAACELGFVSMPEFVDLTQRTLATMERLPKINGHLYNWYNTQTLEPLLPVTISSVDSGNLAASLYTLRAGALSLLLRPLLSGHLFAGLHTHWKLLLLQKDVPSTLAAHILPAERAPIEIWVAWALSVEQNGLLQATVEPGSESAWWLEQTHQRISVLLSLVHDYAPWLLPEFAALRSLPQLGLKLDEPLTMESHADFIGQLEGRLARAWATLSADQAMATLMEQLRSLLPAARERSAALAMALRETAEHAQTFAERMDFRFLLRKDRQLLSIGYEAGPGKLHTACYDMLASEARIATFIAVARGEVPEQVWFKLSRTHTMAFGQSLLLSWTGTMFEYVMPSLWMRSYPDTLVARSLVAAVEVQRTFARKLRLPWGISESGYGHKDSAGHYHYQAFGIPQIALKWDATDGPVISPYSSFLALGIDAEEALHNLRRMAKAGWIGAYGFYEAADFSESLQRPIVVREWMAHHQGMSLLAILNLLCDNVVQRWFHANPQLQAAEQLLHEKPVREAILKAEYEQFAPKPGPALSKAS